MTVDGCRLLSGQVRWPPLTSRVADTTRLLHKRLLRLLSPEDPLSVCANLASGVVPLKRI